MTSFKELDKSKALCSTCGPVSTTFRVKDMPLATGEGIVPNLLVGVCDECEAVVSIPSQSTPQIKAAIEKFKSAH